MRKHLQGVDHAVIAVADLDRAQADFEHLGFTLTPRGHHTKGSENHCAMFPDDYFELLAVPVDPPRNPLLQRLPAPGRRSGGGGTENRRRGRLSRRNE